MLILSLALLTLGSAGCRVTQEEAGEAPDVDVEVDPGEVPEYDVEGPDVDVESETREVTVPEVEVETEEKEVTVPDVDVTLPGEEEEGN
ncbi:hypothetical protein IQ241_01990 [Romeria aff. gracilis LEGE 07310]|uniref:Uncharacterized protein n=1 Tax=Vasconcelosia minhoensis LEGE 07310 TaxID=915328 RepID=A0A8J7AJZ3_9CYAN|nr:hypothetical protein [Romeria aff. gracilis LEGE 07310]